MNGVQCVFFSKLVTSPGFSVRYVRNGVLDFYDTEESNLYLAFCQFRDFIENNEGC